MNLRETKDCPRKSFLRDVPASQKKAAQLKSIASSVLIAINPKASSADIKQVIHDKMETKVTTMLPFEKEKEEERMCSILERYLDWEKFHKGKVLAKDETVKVNFVGKDHMVKVHKLILRNGCIEAINYKYRAPQYAFNSRKFPIKENPDLLLMQLAGEELMKKLSPGNVLPVFGCYYFLKSAKDTSKIFEQTFESSLGDNIYNWNFTAPEQRFIEKEYATVVPSATMSACGSVCHSCIYDDLCHIEFQKRKLMDMPDAEIISIDKFTLTQPQHDLVTFDNGVCRVNAVAGSGKTTVITLRTLRLLEEDWAPENILMMTFTDKARNEMKSRLLAYANGNSFKGVKLPVEKVQIETFNSWGQKILDDYYSRLGFSKKPELIDDIIKKDILLDLLDRYRMFPLDYRNPFMSTREAQGCVIQMVQVIDALKASHVDSPEEALDVVGNVFSPFAKELFSFYKEYNQKLVDMNLIDYEDQLRLILELEKYGIFNNMKYEHMIIDEFQDSNPNQIELISKIKRCDKSIRSLVVVGDDMQSIYGFRNSTPENLVEFDKLFPEVVDINLEDNFRSQTPIISLANKILEKESAIKKAIIAHKKDAGINPVLKRIEKVDEETELYVKQTKKLLADGESASSIAVLCRTKGELIKIQQAMNAEHIPTVLKVPEIVGDSPYVKAIIALALFFKDNESQIDLALYAKSLGQDPFDKAALQKSADFLTATMASKTSESEKIQFFFDLCADAAEDFIAVDFLKALQDRNFNALCLLLTYCAKYKQYITKESHSTSKEDVDAVTLITVHSSKGLEWKTVLLSLKKFQTASEERRLLYVAVTRAKEKLLITYQLKQDVLIHLLD